jgi:hypothetical protein
MGGKDNRMVKNPGSFPLGVNVHFAKKQADFVLLMVIDGRKFPNLLPGRTSLFT